MSKLVAVAAGVIFREDGAFLLGRRAPGSFYPGYWEFPGGKVESGENPAEALRRELREELGIDVGRVNPWITREHAYEHASVKLHFFEVPEWHGEVNDHVHDALTWVMPQTADLSPMLPANGPVLKALRLPRFMGITHAGEVGTARQLDRLDHALAAGLRFVQVREPDLDENQRRAFCREVVARVREHGGLVVINGAPKLASEVAADGLHLKSAELASLDDRPDFEWVGASCHDAAELQRAATLGLDYAVLGAVRPTLTHPGVEGMGWQRFSEMARDLPMPVFALGGLGPADMAVARQAGAHGIAAIRQAWA